MDVAHKKNIVVATHNGAFHADDVCAVALCRLVFGDTIQLIRTRDEEQISHADIVLDVGMEYDPERFLFDHHQAGGAGERTDTGIPYSSFGLVWKHFGKQVVSSDDEWHMIDEGLVSFVDALDNGLQTHTRIKDIYPESYDVHRVITRFRPVWNSANEENAFNQGFDEACDFAYGMLQREIRHAHGKREADIYVQQIYDTSVDKRLVIFDRYAPWERVLSLYPEPLCVVYPSSGGSDWIVEVVRNDVHDFKSVRISIPETWAGKRGKELEVVTGVKGAEFAHRGRFMAVAHTKEGALQLAELVLSNQVTK